jgi:hypothetical protein
LLLIQTWCRIRDIKYIRLQNLKVILLNGLFL